MILKKLENTSIRSLCIVCNKALQKKDYTASRRAGKNIYRAQCSNCEMKRYGTKEFWVRRRKHNMDRKRPYRIHRKEFCAECGFIAKHIKQMDIHHLDGDHHNNDTNNLITLCANCHRLKHLTPSSSELGGFLVSKF